MSDKAFAKMMGQIAKEAEKVQAQEEATQRRRQLYARLRGWTMGVLWTALLASGYFYRVELQQFVNDKFFTNDIKVNARTSEALKGIEASASKRDEVLENLDFAKKPSSPK